MKAVKLTGCVLLAPFVIAWMVLAVVTLLLPLVVTAIYSAVTVDEGPEQAVTRLLDRVLWVR